MHGQLATNSATDVCRELAETGATGVLVITGPRTSGRLVFDGGRLVAAGAPTPGSRLGDRLVAAGLLRQDALDRVLEEQHESPPPERPRLGQLLVDRGLASADAVRLVLQEQVLDAVFELAGWRDGSYRFEPDAALDVPEVPFELSVDQALIEVARRHDEWEAVSEVITDLDAVPRARELSDTATASLEPDELAVMTSVDGARSVRDLAGDLGYGEFEAARIIYALHLRGLLEMVPPIDEIGAALDDALSYVGGQDPPGTAPDLRGGDDDEDGRESGTPPTGDAHLGTAPTDDVDDAFDPSIFDQAWAGADEDDAGAVDEPAPWSSPGVEPEESPRSPATPAADPDPTAADAGDAPRDGDDTAAPEAMAETGLPDVSGFEELRFANRHTDEEPPAPTPPAPEEPRETPAPRQRAPRSPSPGAGGDVSEFLRELSRLALDEENPAPPGDARSGDAARPPREPPRPRPAESRDEPKRKKRGLFGFGG